MKITLKKNARLGDLLIEPGDYLISLHTEVQQIKLVGRGMEYCLPANKRMAKSKSKITQVNFMSMGGPSWTLSVTTPQQGEWFVFLTMVEDKIQK